MNNVNINSTNSSTIYIHPREPYAKFTLPYFLGVTEPQEIIFWTKEEAQEYLEMLPSDWLAYIILN